MDKVIILSVIVLLLLVGVIYSVNSYHHMLKVYSRYDKEFAYCNLTGLDYAKYAIPAQKLKTKIAIIDKELGECYLPKKDIVCISRHTAQNCSVSSICVVAHEIGHAVQNKNQSGLFVMQTCLSVLSRVCLFFFPFLLVTGIVLFFIPDQSGLALTLLLVAFAMLLVVFILKVVTIPMEKQASKIAYKFLKDNKVLSAEELKHGKKVLDAALGTYIAGLFMTIIKFFRGLGRMFKR